MFVKLFLFSLSSKRRVSLIMLRPLKEVPRHVTDIWGQGRVRVTARAHGTGAFTRGT